MIHLLNVLAHSIAPRVSNNYLSAHMSVAVNCRTIQPYASHEMRAHDMERDQAWQLVETL